MTQRPAPFSAYTTPEFWNDPHISARLLECHLDPSSPLASRPAAFMDRSVEWLIPALQLAPGARVLDLGCGPGLYAHRIARRGVEVLGIDVSSRSLDHAREIAQGESLPAEFREGSYLTTDLGSGHDAAILVYEDYCVLSPAQRVTLLRRIHAALLPAGRLLFDVTSTARFPHFSDGVVRAADLMDGFWAEPPYLGTKETWTYPELHLALERYTIETGTSTREFWNWVHCLTPQDVAEELEPAGFGTPAVFGDVTGSAYDQAGLSFTVVAVAHRRTGGRLDGEKEI